MLHVHVCVIEQPCVHMWCAQVQSMDDNCGEWVECMGVASGCGEQEVGVASGSGWNLWVWLAGGGCGWNLWVWLVGVVVRRYIDFLILLIPTPLVSVLFCSSIPTFCSFFNIFFILVPVLFCNIFIFIFFAQYKHIRATTGVPRQPYEGYT